MKIINNKFKVSSEELTSFSEASGDWNPIHYDEEISRRYFAEKPIIQGILSLLKILDAYLLYKKVNLISIKCNFKSPVYPDIEYKLYFEELSNSSENIYLFNDDILLLNCNLRFNYDFKNNLSKSNYKKPSKTKPINQEFKNLEKSKGELKLQLDKNFLKKYFHSLIDNISIESLASLIATSRLVGMICPGLNSIYSSLDIFFNEKYSKKYLYWEVTSARRKFLPVNISLNSPGLSGTLCAFYREKPVKQMSIKEISKKIDKKNLSPQNILVIGGSRGIGEITAKLLSFRNANIKITYNKGLNDAERITHEINEFGFKASCSYLNILDFELLENFINSNEHFNQIYFYASPRIKNSSKKIFDYDLYENYNRYYIKPLINISQILSKFKNKKSKIFFPSTIFIDEEKNNLFKEYQASKLLGEQIVENINSNFENIFISYSRLPRLLTDQTSKIDDLKMEDSLKVINKILDEMYS